MAYSVTAVHWTYRKNVKDIYFIKILVTVNSIPTFLPTPHKVHKDQWDKENQVVKNHPNAREINADLRRLISAKETELLQATRAGEKITRELIKGVKPESSFIKFAQEIAKRVKNKKGEDVVEPRVEKELNRLIAYKGSGILLADIDVTWLRKYNEHEKARGIAQNTRNTTFKYLRRVMTQAASEKLIKSNPFDDYDIPKYEQGDTVYLVEEEKAALIKLFDKLPSGPLYNTLCYFLLACYAGPRHSDWRKFHENNMAYDGFLRLRPKKKSTGFVVLPIGPTLNKILKRIQDLNAPPMSLQKCNEYLKALFAMAEVKMNGKKIIGIKKEGTTHVGRHSFGYQCASLGIPKSTTAELLGVTVQTVEVYYHLTGENIIKQAAALKGV
jgi:site-specific recombinase XerD